MRSETAVSDATKALLELSDSPGMGAVALRGRIDALRGSTHTQPNGHAKIILRPDDTLRKRPRAKEILGNCYRYDLAIISPLDQDYPPLLVEIKDYPPFLYIKGDRAALRINGCAVVGTRKSSPLGESWARQISALLVQHGFSVVSGLALGIDTAAHQGALKHSGITIAILAHGLDKVTPGSNAELAEEIVSTGGALVSEHPPGVPPRRAEYVRRNRLQSGMSLCSIIVESGKEGGAIHQANFTREQGHDLFAVLPPRDTRGTDEFNWEGADFLIRNWRARPISNRADLLQQVTHYQHVFGERVATIQEKRARATLL